MFHFYTRLGRRFAHDDAGDRHEGRGRRGHDHGRHDGEGRDEGRGGMRGDRRGGRGGLGRFFAHGDLRMLILHLIAEKPRHGYEIIKEIEDRVAGAYSPSPGVIYPTLTLLEELGQIVATPGEGARKAFSITPEGEAAIAANRPALAAILARIEAAAEDAGPAPQVMRAMHNLRLAIRMRLSRGMDDTQARAIAEALDAAAVAVERA